MCRFKLARKDDNIASLDSALILAFILSAAWAFFGVYLSLVYGLLIAFCQKFD